MSNAVELHVFDDTSLGLIPPDARYVGVYVDGLFSDIAQARAMFPRATLVPITVFGQPGVRWADCEPGDLTSARVAAWAKAELDNHRRPGIYTSVSNIMAVVAELAKLGVRPGQVDFWSAHYTGIPHICGPQCSFGLDFVVGGTQYTDRALGRSLDASLFFAAVLGAHPKPAQAPVGPLAIFPTAVPGLGNERKLVEQVNGALKHPRLYRGYLKGKLYRQVKLHRDRLWRISKYEPASFTRPRTTADWRSDHRGERWQKLNELMQMISKVK